MNLTKGRTGRRRGKRRWQHKRGENVVEGTSGCHYLLFQWAKPQGFNVRLCGLIPKLFPDTGRGMSCKRALCKGNLIISIPDSLIVTTASVMSAGMGSIIQRFHIKGLSPTNVLCTFLLVEQYKGNCSTWEPYIRTLPSTYTTPCYWSENEIQYLPPWIKEKALLQWEDVQKSFEACCILFDKLTTLLPGVSTALSFENYRWAWNTINTRAVYMEQNKNTLLNGSVDNLALAPILDLLNHSPTVQVDAGYNKQTNCYEIRTQDAYSKHDQVFISYGPHDNIKLLVEYGFVLPDNPHSAVPFDLDDLEEALRDMQISNKDKQRAVIRDQHLHEKMCCTLDGISWNLKTSAQILMLEPQHFSQWKFCLMEKIISTQHEELTKQFLLKLLNRKLEQCENVEEMKTENYHQTMIKQICLEQVQILKHCIGTVT